MTFPTTGTLTARHHNTRFRYARYRIYCTDGNWYSIDYEARPYQFVGGANSIDPGSGPPGNYCTEYEGGSGYVRDDTKAVTWSTGVKMGVTEIGINLSAQTGFTTTAKVSYTFQSDAQLCGDTDYPPDAKRLKAFSVK